MSCSSRHTVKDNGVWRLGQGCVVGVMTDTDGDVTWHTKCRTCGIYSDPIPASVASKWGVPAFDVSMTSRTLLGFDEEILAEGWYNWKIIGCEERKVNSEKNKGKPMYLLTLMVADGSYLGRKQTTWVCLFDGAWWSYKAICKALGMTFDAEDVAKPDDLIGQHLRASVKWQAAWRGGGLEAAVDKFGSLADDPNVKGKIRIAI